jgi:transcriptional regulator with XRE-family HTH domain
MARLQLLYPLKTTIVPPHSPSIVLLSVSVPAELSQAIKALREAEGLTICEWMLKDPRVRKWARAHDVPLPKPGKKRIPRDAARWLELTEDDWNRGIRHVANLLGVSRQAVAWTKKRLRPG